MAIYSLTFNDKPVSVNRPENRDVYERSLLNQIKEKYNIVAGTPAFFNRRAELYVLLVFIYKDSQFGDFDNYLKYTVDAFKNCIYADDKSVKFFQVFGIPQHNALNYMNVTDLDEASLNSITEFITDASELSEYRDLLGYFECGEITQNFYKLRLGDLWK